MKIGICTVGSTGDIQPYLALAVSLQDAGHQIKVISHPFHRHRFEQFGLSFSACGPDTTQQELNAVMDKILSMRNPLQQLKILLLDAILEQGESYFYASKAALMDCDLAICHMIDFLGSEAAAQLGMPRIGGILAPVGIASRYSPPARMPSLGPWLNPLLWKLLHLALLPLDQACADFLKRVGGPTAIPRGYHILSPDLNLIASSPTLAPTYKDLPRNMEVMGPWILKEKQFQPSEDLVAFLERHPKPVIVSFGSMGGTRGPQLAETVLEALARGNRPAILQRGYSGLISGRPRENVFLTDFVPHEWLFPKAACVVHHGGAGTSTAVARAGVPHIPVVFFADQPFFAKNIRRLGIGTKMLWYHQMTPDNLARRLEEACDRPEMQARAKRLQPVFLAEEGNLRTVNRIEKFLREVRP